MFNFNPRTHEECDLYRRKTMANLKHFNPRTHEECDNCNHHFINTFSLFQSTHSRGVRLEWIPPNMLAYHFNPRTHEECDKSSTGRFILLVRFQSTHSRGVRLSKFAHVTQTMQRFQSTHSRGVRLEYLLNKYSNRSVERRAEKECRYR